MRVVVLGAGYVGCVTAACLAELGHWVVAVDTAPAKVEALNLGRAPVVETGLDLLVARVRQAGRLRAAGTLVGELDEADIVLICVATPTQADGSTDATPVRTALGSVLEHARARTSPLPTVVRSTILAGTLRQLIAELHARVPDHPLRIAVNPEFLRETTAIADFRRPPFIVVGGDDAKTLDTILQLYAGVEVPTYKLSLETAALVKYASNTFHAVKIAFANEIATAAELTGADPQEVLSVFQQDHILNISTAYLNPGFAFGGSCLPKDLRALTAVGHAGREPLPLLSGTLASNQRRVEQAVEVMLSYPERRCALLGLSFKRGSDDLRESPYVELARRLLEEGFHLKIYDPDLDAGRLVGANLAYVSTRLPGFSELLVPRLAEAVQEVDAIVLCKPVLAPATWGASIPRALPVYDLEYHAARLGVPLERIRGFRPAPD